MYIEKDFSYISTNETMLMDKGYGKMSVHSIHFDRHYSEEQMEKNRLLAESMTREEWSKHCDSIAESFAKPMEEIVKQFTSKYDIYQACEYTGKKISFDSDWDLFFWSDRGWNGKDFMTHFKLNFNKERSPEQNMTLLDEIISLVETMEYENIGCRIQYDAVIDNAKVETEAKTICERLVGKFIDYHGMTGKIKVVRDENGIKEYGFFKKNARKKYYRISNVDILAMNMQL